VFPTANVVVFATICIENAADAALVNANTAASGNAAPGVLQLVQVV
jgi:hypothetical protein